VHAITQLNHHRGAARIRAFVFRVPVTRLSTLCLPAMYALISSQDFTPMGHLLPPQERDR
jgi:hypothetical protein